MDSYNVAVVGVGAVGEAMIRTLKRRRFPIKDLRVLARSQRNITVGGESYSVRQCVPEAFEGVDIALFAGTEGDKGASAEFARLAAQRGATVIDNSSYFRMEPDIPLVVPEVNPEDLDRHQGIIANPNCSTIQMVVALKPLHDAARIKRVIVSTYQAVSGAGRSSVDFLRKQVEAQIAGLEPPTSPDHFNGVVMAFNVLPQIDAFDELGYTKEEWKMVRETQKIFHDSTLAITATAVRVPVYNGHSESIYIETETKLTADRAREILAGAPGIILMDNPSDRQYAMPSSASGSDEVFVSRVREDPFVANALSFWVVADNVLKGAATNAVQIAE
ncbi:MAG: aspartate-semialdehyde dehydrogenase, partial [Armatimonadota bacterium]|nr:aspartate-semialdehyde dehydrogenase [Armatimonadota bacterium]